MISLKRFPFHMNLWSACEKTHCELKDIEKYDQGYKTWNVNLNGLNKPNMMRESERKTRNNATYFQWRAICLYALKAKIRYDATQPQLVWNFLTEHMAQINEIM